MATGTTSRRIPGPSRSRPPPRSDPLPLVALIRPQGSGPLLPLRVPSVPVIPSAARDLLTSMPTLAEQILRRFAPKDDRGGVASRDGRAGLVQPSEAMGVSGHASDCSLDYLTNIL